MDGTLPIFTETSLGKTEDVNSALERTFARKKVDDGIRCSDCSSWGEEVFWMEARVAYLENALIKEIGDEKYKKLYSRSRGEQT
jgi:hypothetical protein